jgi:hypothetical protein
MLLLIDGNNLAWAGYYALERAMKPENDERRARVALLGLSSMILGAIARDGTPPTAGPPAAAGRRSPSKQASMALDDPADTAASANPARTPVTRVAIAFDEGRPLRRRET